MMTPFVMWTVLDRLTLLKGPRFETEEEATQHAKTEEALWRARHASQLIPSVSVQDATGPYGVVVPILCVQVDGCVFVISDVGWKIGVDE